MENATKALVIAGAVLIAILLIGYMIKTLNSTQGTVDAVEEKLSASEVNMFNSKITKYLGEKKSYADILSLLNEILVNNANSEYKIGVQFYIDNSNRHSYKRDYTTKYINDIIKTLSNNKNNTFNVKITEYTSQGRILVINIYELNSKPVYANVD